ncbi:thiol reductant ABC exporter subunit CydC [Castellaniella caeni]|uniref:thiol reductant ABC exporter subunit CydC n=1 Tax=Castellaniella caeni TaxID=266123 RepID=UPI00082DA7B8|nr:thiol reductant ABC exporter subunit CydC [Castellaniella caeni]
MRIIETLLAYARGHYLQLLAALVLAVLSAWAGIGLFAVAGWFLSKTFIVGASIAFDLFSPSALVRGLSFLRISLRYAERISGHTTTLNLLASLRTRVFARILALSPRQLARYRDGELVARLTSDIDVLDQSFLTLAIPALSSGICAISFAYVAGHWMPTLAWTTAACLLVCAWLIPAWLAYAVHRQAATAQIGEGQVRSLVQAATNAHTDIVAFGTQPHVQQAFVQAARALAAAQRRQANVGALGQGLQDVGMGAAIVLALWIGLDGLHAHRLDSAPVWVGIVLATISLFEVASPLMQGASRLGAIAEAARRVQALFHDEPSISSPPHPLALPESSDIVLQAVQLAYPGGPLIFDAFDLALPEGTRTAIVGPSGAGKSTLLALLLRLIDPLDGRVLLGGIDLRQLDLEQLHRRIAILSQDSPVFMGTIRENLQIGAAEASEAQMWHVLEQAHLADFVRGLDDGLDAWVGESGRTLSAGQARRLCLARILLTSARVWLLDEPTAGLDMTTAQALLHDLADAAGTRTVLLATHDRFPDEIFDMVLSLGGKDAT